ncbi:acyl-CoA dehydrogenase family protein [Nocardia caishijiensis]|uniref:Alkylation response protein AidB-like acyl-CoA dehydrogenase n=1 Tax=Nocardia caishijiensis TaxID=184756 RepID=A0ABQ6YMV3_9NOCA|nr:acyl-CoA dehydrogenase family protein [Nocardia caishijiensis]KAF0846796.1 alkylation response protein AidB-like acyl-CoA dehydrogenase [Nocardia caishijiensis]
MTREELHRAVAEFLAVTDPATTDRREFLRARFDAGLAWVYYPVGLGGLGLPREWQGEVDRLFAEAGAPDNNPGANTIGLGMAAPTILACGTEEQQRRFLRPLWTGEEIWCQLFSEPGAGSDLANVGTRAVRDGDEWVVDGQKVWTSSAHLAHFAILLARTDPGIPKHRGLTFFLIDVTQPGVEVRPLRQITGEAEFNEVFLTEARVPDTQRVSGEGDGWRVANTTLNTERVAIGGKDTAREAGMIGVVSRTWRDEPELRTPELHDRLLRLWVEAEVARQTGMRLRQKLAKGMPGPEGSAMKLIFARVAQQLSGLEVEMLGERGLRYADWTMVRPDHVDFTGRDAGYRYLRAKGNSIEGGTSEILRNIVAERILGLPAEARTDKDRPWKDVAR